MWSNFLRVIVWSWFVARYVWGRCPEYHTPEVSKQVVFGKTVILSCDLGHECTEGMWVNNRNRERLHASIDCNEDHCVAANDANSRNTLYLYNFTFDQIGSYDCVCKSPLRKIYVCYDLIAVCELEISVGPAKKVYHGSYLTKDQRTHPIDIKGPTTFNVNCQHGAKMESNCTGTATFVSTSLNGCEYKCELPMSPGVDPCTVSVVLQVKDSRDEQDFTDAPMTTKSLSQPDRLTPGSIRAASDLPLLTDLPSGAQKKRPVIEHFFPPDTPLHTKVMSILIYCSAIGVMLMLVATSVVRIYHIYIRGEGKYKADVYRPGSIHGQQPDKNYRKYADVVSDRLDTSTNSRLLAQDWSWSSSAGSTV